MNPLTRRVFSSIPRAAQQEFNAWFRNALQRFAGDIDPNDMRLPPAVRAYGVRMQQATDMALKELAEIFARENLNLEKNDLNCHLGTRRIAE